MRPAGSERDTEENREGVSSSEEDSEDSSLSRTLPPDDLRFWADILMSGSSIAPEPRVGFTVIPDVFGFEDDVVGGD